MPKGNLLKTMVNNALPFRGKTYTGVWVYGSYLNKEVLRVIKTRRVVGLLTTKHLYFKKIETMLKETLFFKSAKFSTLFYF